LQLDASLRVYLRESTDTQWPKRGLFFKARQNFGVRL
jgi:hypothetical protein